jgi:hypothetical protein
MNYGLEELVQYWKQIRNTTTANLRKSGILTHKQFSLPENIYDAQLLGCGFWGCVWRCHHNPRFAIKLTFDPVEGPVVFSIINDHILRYHPGSVYYHGLWAIPRQANQNHILPKKFFDIERNDDILGYLILRENAEMVNEVCKNAISLDDSREFNFIGSTLIRQKKNGNGRKPRLKWKKAIERLFEHDETVVLANFILLAEERAGIIFKDLHCGNIGKRVYDFSDVFEHMHTDSLILMDPGHSHVDHAPQLPLLDLRENPTWQKRCSNLFTCNLNLAN